MKATVKKKCLLLLLSLALLINNAHFVFAEGKNESSNLRSGPTSIKLVVPDIMYENDGKWPLLIGFGADSAFLEDDSAPFTGTKKYIWKIKIDGYTIITEEKYYNQAVLIEDLSVCGISMSSGTKRISVKIETSDTSDTVLEQELTAVFSEDKPSFSQALSSVDDSDISAVFDISGQYQASDFSNVCFINSKDNSIRYSVDNPYAMKFSYDYRYYTDGIGNKFRNITDSYLPQYPSTHVTTSIYTFDKENNPFTEGTYDLEYTCKGEKFKIKDILRIYGDKDNTVLVDHIDLADEFEHTHDHIHMSMTGFHILPEKVWPVIKNATGKYLEARPIGINKYVYKMPWLNSFKNNLTGYTFSYEDFDILNIGRSSDAGSVIDNRAMEKGSIFDEKVECHRPVFAPRWNQKKMQLVTNAASFLKDGTRVSVTVKEYPDTDPFSPEYVPSPIASGTAAVDNGKLYFELKDNKGNIFSFLKVETGTYTETINGKEEVIQFENLQLIHDNCLLEFVLPGGEYDGTYTIKNTAGNYFASLNHGYSSICLPDKNEYTVNIYEIGKTALLHSFIIDPDDIISWESSGKIDYGYNIRENDIDILDEEELYDIAVINNTNHKIVYYGRDYIQASSEADEEKRFKLKRDNNNFIHNNGKGHGFEGKNDYSFHSKTYYDSLIKNEQPYTVSNIISHLYDTWGGSCYGIASTMGLLYHNKTNTKDYSDKASNCYYELPRPAIDNKFMDVINYYQLSQFTGHPSKACIYSGYNTGQTIDGFLKEMYKETKDNNAVMFCYGIPSGGGHAILALNSEDNEDGSHRIKLYDMNSYNSNGGKFTYMDISSDYRAFTFTDGNGKVINQDNYTCLETEDWNKMKLLKSETSAVSDVGSVNSNDYAVITVADNTTITNAEGKWLKCSDGKLSGDLKVYEINPISADENSLFMLKVDDSDKFIIEGSTLNISVGSNKGYMSVKGDGFNKVMLSYGDGIQMEGSEYSFKAFMQTDNDIKDNQKGLASFEGKGSGVVTVKKNGKEVTASGTLSDVTATNYIGINKYEEVKTGQINEFTVDTERNLSKGDNENTVQITVSDNKPMDYKEEIRGDYRIGYYSSVPFWGKSKPTVANFGAITVSGNNALYEVTKIKVNKKKGLIQITGMKDADKKIIKEIKRATKGSNGLPFKTNPYFVRDTDQVSVKLNKNGSAKTVKVTLGGKPYKAKKGTEWSYDIETNTVTFFGDNLDGSFKAK